MDLEPFIAMLRAKSPLVFLNDFLKVPLDAIAERLNVSQSFLSHVKKGTRKLSSKQGTEVGKMLEEALDLLEDVEEDDTLVGALLSAVLNYGEEL